MKVRSLLYTNILELKLRIKGLRRWIGHGKEIVSNQKPWSNWTRAGLEIIRQNRSAWSSDDPNWVSTLLEAIWECLAFLKCVELNEQRVRSDWTGWSRTTSRYQFNVKPNRTERANTRRMRHLLSLRNMYDH